MPSWLDSIFDFLEDKSGAITALATVAVAIVTGILVWITRRYAKTTDKMLKASDTPKILVFLSNLDRNYGVGTLDFCVQNIGTGFAYKVNIAGNFPALYPYLSDEPLTEHPIIKNGIESIGPGNQYYISILWHHDLPALPEKTIDITVTYRDSRDKEHKDKLCLDFTYSGDSVQTSNPSIDRITRVLRQIDQTLIEIKNERDN